MHKLLFSIKATVITVIVASGLVFAPAASAETYPGMPWATLDSSDVVCVTDTIHLGFREDLTEEYRRYWFALDSSYIDAWLKGEVGFDRDGPCGDFSVKIDASIIDVDNARITELSEILFSNYVGDYNPDQEVYSDLDTPIDPEAVTANSSSRCFVDHVTDTNSDYPYAPEETVQRYELDRRSSCLVTQSQNTKFRSSHGDTPFMLLENPSDER